MAKPKNIIMGAFAGHYDIKQVVVVDMDVDIDEPSEIEWAIATRFQADRDLLVVSGAQGSKLDPSSCDGVSAKMGIDATKPLSTEPMEFKRIHVKGIENVDLGRVLQDDPKAAFARMVAGLSYGTAGLTTTRNAGPSQGNATGKRDDGRAP